MFKLLFLAALIGGGFYAYKRLMQPVDDSWDDDTMYGSAQLHQTADAPAAPTA